MDTQDINVTSKMRNYSQRVSILIIHLLFITVFCCLTVYKVFFMKDVYAFDNNDDARLTFPIHYVAQQTFVSTGELPQINYYSNFGTPMLGDPNGYFFAPHSLAYYIFPGPIAMTINRIMLCCLTLLAAIKLYSLIGDRYASFIFSLITFYNPIAIHFFATHHFQTGVLYFILFCYVALKANSGDISSRSFFIFSAVINICIIMSVSIGMLVLTYPILAMVYIILFPNKKRLLVLAGVAALPGLILVFPHLYNFIIYSMQSGRIHSEYVLANDMNALAAFLGDYGKNINHAGHLHGVLYIDVAILLTSLYICVRKCYDNDIRPYALLGLSASVLILIILFIFHYKSVWFSIPFLKSVDISRSFCFLNICICLPIVRYFTSMGKRDYLFLAFFSIGQVVVTTLLRSEVFVFPLVGNVLYSVALIALFLASNKMKIYFSRVALAALFISSFHAAYYILGLNKHSFFTDDRPSIHFSAYEGAYFQPQSFLSLMPPQTRFTLASIKPNIANMRHDDIGCYSNHLGSNANSILIDNSLYKSLLLSESVSSPNELGCQYFFSFPFDSSLLRTLGISYVLSIKEVPNCSQYDLDFISSDKGFLLYYVTNPNRVVYLSDPKINSLHHLPDFNIVGNTIMITNIESTEDLSITVAMSFRYGYSAFADGKEVPVYKTPLNLIEVRVPAHSHNVTLRFGIWNWIFVAILSMTSLAVILCTSILITQYEKRA